MNERTPSFELMHIGMNCADEAAATACAERLSMLFDLPVHDGGKAFYLGNLFEVLKFNGRGTHGHIGIATEDVDAAKAYLEGKGQTFLEETARFQDDGAMNFIFLEGEFAGFFIHLNKK